MFLTEYLNHLIRSKMESPEERTEYWHKHTRRMAANAAKKKQSWTEPTKPYGFWNSDAANAKFRFNKEPGHMALPGRGSPHGGETETRL